MVGGRFFAGSLSSFYGPWLNATNKYVGIQFSINGRAHYGWARLTVKTLLDRYLHVHIRAILTGYAYETQPNTAILAGDEGPRQNQRRRILAECILLLWPCLASARWDSTFGAATEKRARLKCAHIHDRILARDLNEGVRTYPTFKGQRLRV
jgi:hypothetical protein